MALSWSFRRKTLYAAVVLGISFVVLCTVWLAYFTTPSTCFDTQQNGSETGVDCGGSCSLVCASQARAPVVLWARAFPQSATSYTAAAYIQNNNGETAAREVHYTFHLYDIDNRLVVEKEGVMDIPPVQTIPVIESNIDVGNRTVTRALFSFSDIPTWQRVPKDSVPVLRVTGQDLTSDARRLAVTVENSALQDESRVTVVAVLFDGEGVARAASKSTIPLLERRSTKQVVFTWGTGVENIQRAEISILPSF